MKKLVSVFFIFITLFSVAFFVFPKQSFAGSCSVDYDWEFFTRTGRISKEERAVADTWKYFLNYDGGRIEVIPNDRYPESYINRFVTSPDSAWVNYKTCGFGPAVIIGMHPVTTSTTSTTKPVPPTNLQPNGYVLAGNKTFSWDAVSGATTYSYRLDDRANAWSGTCSQVNSGDLCVDNISGRSFNYTLVAGHTYQFWVHANNSAGWSDATTVIIQAVTSLPSGTVAPTTLTTQTPQNSCSTICQNAGFQCGSLQGCTCANTCTNGLVCSYNLCTPTTGTAMCSKPNKPTITTPSGTQMNGGAVTITWTPPTSSSTNTLGANFTHYAVRVDDFDDGNGFPGYDALPPDIVVDNIPKTQTSYTYLGAVPGHHYHIWVHAVNHPYNDCNQWSDPFEIGNIVAIAGATNTPTPTPTPTTGAPQATATIPPSCQLKIKGDSDCNGAINLLDFAAWRAEMINGPRTQTTDSDYNRDNLVNILDFAIWRENFLNPPPSATSTQAPTATSTPTPTPTPTPNLTQLKAFVTSISFDGNLGGLTGADQKCQDLANTSRISGTYKAWLSSSTVNAKDRFNIKNLPYYRLDGVKIADNFADLIDGSIQNAIYVSDLNQNLSANGYRTMTATSQNGMFAGGSSCADWTSNSNTWDNSHITLGRSEQIDSLWTSEVTNGSCAAGYRLYCFEDR